MEENTAEEIPIDSANPEKDDEQRRLDDLAKLDDQVRHILFKRANERSYDDLLTVKARIEQMTFLELAGLHPGQVTCF